MIHFNDIEVGINGSGLFAQSVSVSTDNSTQYINPIGFRNSSCVSENGPVKSNIRITYLLEPERAYNQAIISNIKNLDGSTNFIPAILSIAGLTGNGYLSNFSFDVGIDNSTIGNATYIVFENISGTLSNVTGLTFNTNSMVNLLYNWNTYINDSGYSNTNPYDSIGYSFQANWEPTYIIGQNKPYQIDFIGAREELNISKEDYTKVGFRKTGIGLEYLGNSNVNFTTLNLDTVEGYPVLMINISGGIISSTNLEGSLDNKVKNTLTIVKNY